MNESAVQRKIIERYNKRGWTCIKLIQTTLNGIPDLMLLKGGRAVFIEVKRPGGYVEPLQTYRQQQLTELGFKAYITDDPAFDFEKPFTKTLVKGLPEREKKLLKAVTPKMDIKPAPKAAGKRKIKRND